MQKTPPLWRISVTTSAEAEEAVSELLARSFNQAASSYTDLETGATRVTVFFQSKPAWSRAARTKLRAGLERIRKCGLKAGPGRAALARVRREDWAESWKRHFWPIELGSKLLIRPSWSRRRPRQGQALVVLDPGLSFGTGQHPTTSFCLRQLAEARRPGTPQSLLDIGSGSGILAIAAAKLGYAPVEAFDYDPEAVRIARANARQNRVSAQIRFRQQDVTRLSSRGGAKFDVVCANLTANLLLAERGRILAQLAGNGALVLAGILKREFAPVRRAYESAGLRLLASRTGNEWRSGKFGWRRGRT